jgi:P4 family phage/plasmid primase-like protien
MSEAPEQLLADRLDAAGFATGRFIDVQNGKKSSVDHEQGPPTVVDGNYGIYANGDDALCILDIDDYDDLEDKSGISALHKLPATLEQGSPHDGTHRFYRVEPSDDGRLVAAALKDAFQPDKDEGKGNLTPSWGEVRVNNQYVVGAGSQLDGCLKDWCTRCADEDGGHYVLQADREIATIEAEELIDVLSADPALSKEPEETDAGAGTKQTASPPDDVDERLSYAREHDDKLDRLMRGDYSAYGGDRSKAEYVLAYKLAFWLGRDRRTVRQVIEHDARTKKWDERPDDSYRESVLAAVDDQTEFYSPSSSTERDNGAPDVTASDHAQDHTETDGGAAAAEAPADVSRHADLAPEERARQRILDHVIVPYDPPEDIDVESIDKQTAVHRAAEIYHDELAWLRPREDTRGWRSTLYNYAPEDGIYEPHGEAELERMLDSHFGALADNELVSQVVRKVERMARVNVRRLDEPPHELVVANGILNLETGELSEHTPAKFHQTMVDIEYDPEAECPRVDDFLHDVVDDSDVPMLYRLIAHALYKEYEAEKAAMLLGDGQNGKSVFLSLVEQFLGEWNVSNQSLQKLNEDDWAANNLVGKLANVHPDMSDQTVSTMQMFKKLTGRDTIAADVKFEQPIRFQNFATLIFACNRMPVLEDDTRGNWRRWILIDFPNTFERGDDDYVAKQELMAELTTEEELQGLLSRCVDEIQRWADGEEWFPDAPHWKEARKQIRRAAEPIYDFTHACLERGDEYVEKEDVRHCYAAYAEAEGLPSMSREEFGRKLINESDMAIESCQKRVDGQRKHVYENIQFTSRGEQLLQDDSDAHTDGKQDSFNSRRARADRVVRLCVDIKNEHMDDGNVSHELLVGAAVQDGMQIDEAEGAIEKARREGDLAGTEESGYLPSV